MRWLISALALAALGISVYLAWSAIGGSGVAGCGGAEGVDCDQVLASRWARWLGIPVSVPAACIYAAILLASLTTSVRFAPGLRRFSWAALLVLATVVVVASPWFLGLQAFAVGQICPYCIAVHACGLTASALIFVLAPISFEERDDHSALRLASIESLKIEDSEQSPESLHLYVTSAAAAVLMGLAATTIFVLVHVLVKPRSYVVEKIDPPKILASQDATDGPFQVLSQDAADPTRSNDTAAAKNGVDAKGEPDDSASPADATTNTPETTTDAAATTTEPETDNKPATRKFIDDSLTVDLNQQMLLGSIDAPHVVIKLFDYTCPHCRTMHQQLEAARVHYGDQLAVVLMPVPLNKGCNPAVRVTGPRHEYACLFARLAIAVWKQKPEEFPAFHHWLFESETVPEPGAARLRAVEILGGMDLLDKALDDPDLDQRIAANVKIYQDCNAGQIPKLIVADSIFVGEIDTLEEFYKLLEAYLKIKPIDP